MKKLTIFGVSLLIVCVTVVPEIESRRKDSKMESRMYCWVDRVWFNDKNTCMMMCKKGCEGCGGFRSCEPIADAPMGTHGCACRNM